MFPSIAVETYWAISDRLDSSTPFGRDSVPEVYISRSGSSSATGTEGAVSLPGWSIQSATLSHSPPLPPIRPRTTSVRPARFNASAAVSSNASSAISPDTPAWPRINATSSAPSMKFTGTSTTPSLAAANTSTAYSQQLWLSSASRSPFARPRSASRCAQRLTAASNSR